MLNLVISNHNEILTEDLKQRANWIVANIETSIAWPVKVQKITYKEYDYWIIPVTRDAYPGIAARVEGVSREEQQRKIMRLLSIISWVEDKGVALKSFTGGSYPHPQSRHSESGFIIRDNFDFTYLPDIDDENAMLALALMREGRSLNHPGYSFLSFFKVLEVTVGKGNKRKAWMSNALSQINDYRAKEAITKIHDQGVSEVAKHLYESGRCAIAHASSHPIINPDDPTHSQRLYNELRVIEKLAELAIEEKLGVQTSFTVYKEHLYELAGFKNIFGQDLINRITLGKQALEGEQVCIPKINVQLRGRTPFTSLENLIPVSLLQDEAVLILKFGHEDGSVQFRFQLNFIEERLEFDIFNDIFVIPDNGTPAFAEVMVDLTSFTKWYLSNGSLEIINSDSGEEIARKDAFIPENIIVYPEKFDNDIERWRDITTSRKLEEIS